MNEIPSLDFHPWSLDSGLPGADDSTKSTELFLMISTTEQTSC